MKSLHSPNPEKLASLFLVAFSNSLKSLGNRNDMFVGLSGGTSLAGFYRAMLGYFPAIPERLRQRIRFAFLDERLVPGEHPDSNFRLLSETLFQPLLRGNLISQSQILRVATGIASPEAEYSARVPRIDIGLFGVGPDGHIASLFPGHSGLRIAGSGYVRIADSPKPPSDRISVSVGMIRAIPYPFAFFIGEAKRGAFERSRNLDTDPESCPVKFLFENENCQVVSDLVN